MQENNIISNEEYINGMLSGIKQIADIIRPTFGGKGKNVIVQSKLYPYHFVTNDAQAIVQSIKVKGYAEKIGSNFIKELCDRQDKLSGNGRKTTILITDSLLENGFNYEGDTNELKRELDALIPLVENEIDKVTRQISVNEVGEVATTASENPETGALLQEIYQKIGKNGIIHVQGSGTYETSYKFTNGYRFDMASLLSADMVHDEQAKKDKVKETKAIYENPYILVTKKKINSDDDINPFLTELIGGERALVIFASDMDSGVASMLVELNKNGKFTQNGLQRLNVCIIKVPSLWRDYYFEDFAKCVGATVIEDSTGKNFKNMQLSDLGTCDTITVDDEETILTGTIDISEHIAHLESKGDDDSKLRLSWLTNKSVVLKLGNNGETDLSLKLLKCKDAIRSSELALKYGVVEGGGLCLYRIANDALSNNDIMSEALKAPYYQNIENGVGVIPTNIVDASMVIKKALRNAIGIASTVLTASALTYIPDLTPIEMQYETAMNKNNPF